MAAYLITGASRGIGFEFLRQLSADPRNTVVGLVRDKDTTERKVAAELQRSNIHIVQADMTDYGSLVLSADDVSKITHGALDYIIANAAFLSDWSAYDSIGKLGNHPQELERDLLDSFKVNVVGNIHLFNIYMPLILQGNSKKVITISSGMADIDLISKFAVESGAPYTISKAGMNAAVAKFGAQYGRAGVLFLSISPGVVDTGHYDNITEEQQEAVGAMAAKFAEYAPHFTGPITPAASVKAMISVINEKTIETGDSGSFISHLGNKQWL